MHDLSVSLKGEGQVEIDWMRFGQNAGEFALQSRASIKPWEQGAFETRKYRNLFAEAGYKQADIDAKLKSVFNDIFTGPIKFILDK